MIDIKVSGLDDLNRKLDALSGHMTGAVIASGCAAAAKEFYNEAKLRAPVLENPDKDGGWWFYGTHSRYWFPAGNLRDSIYRTFSKDNSSDTKVTYHIAWNHQKAPYGFMVEYGTSRAAAHPFLRPAYDAAKGEAVRAAKYRMLQRLKELEK